MTVRPDNTAQLAAPNFQHSLHSPGKSWLSCCPKHTGAGRSQKGDVFALHDSDCMHDPIWLYYFRSERDHGNYWPASADQTSVHPHQMQAQPAWAGRALADRSRTFCSPTQSGAHPGFFCKHGVLRWAFETKWAGSIPKYRKPANRRRMFAGGCNIMGCVHRVLF